MSHTSNRENRRRRLWPAATVTATLVAVTALAWGGLGGEGAPVSAAQASVAAEPAAVPVTVAEVESRQITPWQDYSGRVEAVERVDVRSRVAGAVQSLHFREGALVKKGDLLITIDPAPYAAELDRAEAQVVAAQARVAYSRSEASRARRLLDDHAIAQREFDERQNAQLEAEATLRAAQAASRSARLSLDYTQVRAPVAGRVGRVEVTVGNLVAAGPGAPVLTTLVSVDPIYASFDAEEGAVAQALAALPDERGAAGRLDLIPVRMGTAAMDGTPLAGRLQLIDNQVNASSGTVRLRAVFGNADGSLMPGQFVRLRMGQPTATQAVLIDEKAVGTDQSRRYVMVVDADDKAVYREVTLGAPVDGMRVVTQGLAAGERVVVNGLQHIRPGVRVAPVPEALKKAQVAGARS